MSRPNCTIKRIALSITLLLSLWLLLSWLALPHLLQRALPHFLAEKSGHHLQFDLPRFNPLALRLEIDHLQLVEPTGKPLLQCRRLALDLSAASLWRRALVFDDIRLEGLQTHLVLLKEGGLNWTPLIQAFKSPDDKPDEGLPRLEIAHFALLEGTLDFVDQGHRFSTHFTPLDLTLTELSTLSQADAPGQYRVTARMTSGAAIDWQGKLALQPVLLSGHLGIQNLDLGKLSPYLKAEMLAEPPGGVAGLDMDYRIGYAEGRFSLTLDKMAATLDALRLRPNSAGPVLQVGRVALQGGHYDLAKQSATFDTLQFKAAAIEQPSTSTSPSTSPRTLARLDQIELEKATLNLAQHQITLARFSVQDGEAHLHRELSGQFAEIEFLKALKPGRASGHEVQVKTPATSPSPSPEQPAWHYQIDKVALAGLALDYHDATTRPAAALRLQNMAFHTENLSDDLSVSLPVEVSLEAASGGHLSLKGEIVPSGPTIKLNTKLSGLALSAAQPWMTPHLTLLLVTGKLDLDGILRLEHEQLGFQGAVAINSLRLDETAMGPPSPFLQWKSLASRDLRLTNQGAGSLSVGTLVLDGLDTRLHIAQDKSVNFSRLLRQPVEETPNREAEGAQNKSQTPATASSPGFVARIERLRLQNSQLDFSDQSLAMPFGTRIHHLRGTINGLSTQATRPAQLELSGQVDDYGEARAAGQIALSNPTENTDIQVHFRNVEMRRLTPYSATFAGRHIASGKLSLDLDYKIKNRQLTGGNQVVMDQLTLGERVDSPSATNLPLDLAIALLQDADGRIDLGLPVSGSLDDPKFSYGGLIWKVIVNVLTKIATAPFRALGALLGGSGESLEHIGFEPGDSRIAPPEQEKLLRLASVLGKRPALALSLHGVYTESDRAALKDRQMRQRIARMAGLLEEGRDEDPGPLSMGTPKVQTALEKRYAQWKGDAALSALKAAYRRANPGKMEEGAGEKLLSRLNALLHEPPAFPEDEVTKLKGMDFYALLAERLLAAESVDETRLLALAQKRGQNAQAALIAAGVPASRLTLNEAQKTTQPEPALGMQLGTGGAAPAIIHPFAEPKAP